MRRFLTALLICLLAVAGTANAADTQPSDESLKRLMEVADTKKLLASALGSIDANIDAGVRQALKGKQITESQQKAIDDMRTKMAAVIRESMSWERLEPLFIDIYRRSLTQSEVDGMLAFYSTPAGQAVIAKMPLILQNTMQAMQTQMADLVPRLVKIQQDTLASLKVANEN